MGQLKKFLNYIAKMFSRLVITLKPLMRVVKKFLNYIAKMFSRLVITLKPLMRVVKKFLNYIAKMFSRLVITLKPLMRVVKKFLNYIAKMFSRLVITLKPLMRVVKKFLNYIAKMFSRLVITLKPLMRVVKKFFTYILNLIITLVVSAFQPFLNLIITLVVSAFQPFVRIARKHPIAFVFTMILHIALVVGLFYSDVGRLEVLESVVSAQKSAPTKAVTIDVEVIKAEHKRLVSLEQQKQDKLANDIKRSEVAKKAQKNAEERRKNEEKKAKAAIKKKELAEEKTRQELVKAKEASKKKELAEKKAKEADKQKALAEEKTRQELVKAKAAAKKKELAEVKAKEAERKETIANQSAEESRKKKEVLDAERIALQQKFDNDQNIRALVTEIQAEEDADRRQVLEDIFNQLKENYIGLISGKVRKEWRYQGAEDYWGCDLHIIQSKVGEVLAVNVQNCTIDNSDKAISFKQSIERAAYKASPLPIAPDEDLFDAEIMFQFRVN